MFDRRLKERREQLHMAAHWAVPNMYFPSLATLFRSLSSDAGLNECSMQM